VRDLIALALPPGLPFVEAMRRAWDDGDAVLPVDPRLPAPARERLLRSLRPATLIGEDGRRQPLEGGVPVEDGDAFVIATSGSTGDPKGVVHTHASARASALATAAALEVDPASDGWLCCLPVSHVAGLSVVLRALTNGVPLEIIPAFDAATVEQAARERGATLTTLVPTALARIDPMLFRRIVVGGAAPPKHLPPNAVVSYGMTETGSAITYDGMPLGDAECRVVDGEIHVRGSVLLRAYRGGGFPLEGHDPKDADGWFATDDAGELDADGRLIVHGRRGDLIVTGGEKVWPIEVERVLGLHPGVAEVAVIGRPDPEWGHRVTAIVVPADSTAPPSLAELRAHVKADLPSYAAPRELELGEALPRTLLGKVERRALLATEPR
jgi:O-succinylbenzoic acid--CoA ligase